MGLVVRMGSVVVMYFLSFDLAGIKNLGKIITKTLYMTHWSLPSAEKKRK